MEVAQHIIITTRPDNTVFAVSELQKYDSGIRPVKTLGEGIRLIFLPGGYERLIYDAPMLLFTRHLFPVHWQGAGADFCLDVLNIQHSGDFSVQARGNINQKIIQSAETDLQARGFIKNDKTPVWVLSLYAHEEILYAGISHTKDNRSAWNGGTHRFSKTTDENFISRAEFKLMEAFDVFGITPPVDTNNPRHALDLGAAPGGWSKVLLEKGFHVTAVDPGALDPRLTHPKLTHINATAQRFFAAQNEKNRFDCLVNDMKIDPFDSARIMLDAADCLKPTDFAIMTLKLTKNQGPAKINKILLFLEKKYRVVNTRQLFHNRDEVTVYLTPVL